MFPPTTRKDAGVATCQTFHSTGRRRRQIVVVAAIVVTSWPNSLAIRATLGLSSARQIFRPRSAHSTSCLQPPTNHSRQSTAPKHLSTLLSTSIQHVPPPCSYHGRAPSSWSRPNDCPAVLCRTGSTLVPSAIESSMTSLLKLCRRCLFYSHGPLKTEVPSRYNPLLFNWAVSILPRPILTRSRGQVRRRSSSSRSASRHNSHRSQPGHRSRTSRDSRKDAGH
jgi:hypothetical protein